MADHTYIEWTDATWNPITGCSVVSPGCTNCYAMRLAGTRLQHHPSRAGLTRNSKAGPVWTGKVRLNTEWLDQPLRWKRARRIFVCAHGDLFAENVPVEWIDRVFAIMALAPQHTFQVLTKRSKRLRQYLSDPDLNDRISAALGCMLDGAWVWTEGKRFRDRIEHLIDVFHGEGTDDDGNIVYHDDPMPLPNVWLGVSAEDQRRADERAPDLLATPAAVRFVSAEPLLGPIDFTQIAAGVHDDFSDCGGHPDPHYPIESVGWGRYDTLRGEYWGSTQTPDGKVWKEHEELGILYPSLDWIIVGGESGASARPMHPDWARLIRDQCAVAGVPFFFKQWGEFAPAFDKDLRPRRGYPWKGEDQRAVRDGTATAQQATKRVGKASAGSFLDGLEHRAMPRVAT